MKFQELLAKLFKLITQPSSLAGFGVMYAGLHSLTSGDYTVGIGMIMSGVGAVLVPEATRALANAQHPQDQEQPPAQPHVTQTTGTQTEPVKPAPHQTHKPATAHTYAKKPAPRVKKKESTDTGAGVGALLA
jgi:outer membrane biosynthesis protein TonB